MTTEIATMDSLKSKITDRIRNSFVELIPEEAWKTMVANEIDTLITTKTDRSSALQNLIKDELLDRFRKIIKEELDSQQIYMYGKASDFVKEVIKETAPTLIEELFGRIVQDAVLTIQNNLVRY